jgi:hypothetical protein
MGSRAKGGARVTTCACCRTRSSSCHRVHGGGRRKGPPAVTDVPGGCKGAQGPPMQMMTRPQGELSSSCGLMIWLVNRWFIVWLGSGDRFGLVFASSFRSVPI